MRWRINRLPLRHQARRRLRRHGWLHDLLRDGGRAALMRAAPTNVVERLLPDFAAVSALVVARESLVSGRAASFAALVRLARPAPVLRARARPLR